MEGYSIKAILSLQDKDFTKNIDKANGALNDFESNASQSGKAAARSFSSTTKSAKGIAGGLKFAKASFGTLKTAAVNAYRTIKNSSSKMQGVKDVFSKIASSGKSTFTKLRTDGILSATGVGNAFKRMGGGLKGVFSSIGRGFKSLASRLLSGVILGGLVGIGQAAITGLGNAIRGMGTQLVTMSKAWKSFDNNMKASGHSAKFIKQTKKELQAYAATTLYTSSSMASTFAQLDAVGVKGTTDIVKGFGAIAATAENPVQAMRTLTTQGTQMAAKPKVAWQDFRLMLEQAPAGLAQVAKKMGMSTKSLVAGVQKGEIKTEDFLAAIRACGRDESLQKVATKYKSVGAAAAGVRDTLVAKLVPAFDIFSEMAIKGLAKFQWAFTAIDADSLADGMKRLIVFVSPVFKALGTAISSTVTAFKVLVGAFKAAAGDTFVKVGGKIVGLVKSISMLISKFYKSSAGMAIAKTNGFLLGSAFKVLGGIFSTIAGFITAIVNGLSQLITWLGKAKKALTEFFNGEGLNKAHGAGLLAGSGYTAGLKQGLSGSNKEASKASNKAATALKSGNSFESGSSFGFGFSGGINSKAGAARSAANSLGSGAATKLKQSSGGTKTTGANFGQGFISGMASKIGAAAIKARALASSALKALSNKIKEGSPSKLTRKSGRYFSEGFALGIGDKAKQVQRIATDLVDIPQLQMSRMAYASAFSSELSEAFDYNVSANYEVVVPVNLNGREVARLIATDVTSEQNRSSSFKNRQRGLL